MKKNIPFTGFRAETFRFLRDLEENNYKEWFEAHRTVYETQLLEPFRALISAVSPAMTTIDPAFEMRPHKVLSRIYRDTRFSKDKRPYRTHLWMTFQRSTTHWESFPGYYMSLDTERCEWGMGLFSPVRKIMDQFREAVTQEKESFKEIALEVFEAGYETQGEKYVRPIANDLSDFYQPWLQGKSIYVNKSFPLTDERIYSDALAHSMIEDFSRLAGLYHFMIEAINNE
ncbi:DUF2461 domain-containing protein [Limibacterium fermenti]|uniref:DUF2461 domain-containing protein n=1 Tax=Limibacterium fermenti TaxID=3229863 RepID=UPI000E8052EB|nr:TIGR02453 family protein [Porphyromonadaceae bacterium]